MVRGTMKYFFLTLIICLNPVYSSTKNIVTTGIKNALSIKSQKLRYDNVKNTYTSAWASLLPSFSASRTRSYNKAESVTSGIVSTSDSRTDALSVSANWTIWDNYQNIRNIQTAIVDLESEQINSLNEIHNYILNLLEAYYSYQLLLRRKQILENNLVQNKQTFEESQELVKIGSKTRMDTIDSEIQLINTERDIMELEQSLVVAQRKIRFLLFQKEDFQIVNIDMLTDIPYYMEGFEEKIKQIKKQWQDNYQKVNPTLRVSQLGIDRSRLELSQTKLNYWPKIALSLSHSIDMSNRVKQDIDPINEVNLDSTALSINVTWDFWDWWNTPRSINNSKNDFEINRLDYKNQDFETKNTIQDLLNQYEINEKSLTASRLILKKAKTQYDYSHTMYKLGKVTLLRMQQSVERVFEAENDLADRLKTKYIVAANLLFQMGYDLRPIELKSDNWFKD